MRKLQSSHTLKKNIMEIDESPLVSIVVITYNSSATVLETLESIKNQSYKNIELIISDDCSTDNTQSLVKQWLEIYENSSFFKRTVLISTPKNGGPAVNCNYGIRNARGVWFKLIAADDILLPDCVKNNVEYVTKHNNVQIVFSKLICFGENDEISKFQNDINWNFWKLTRKQQYLLILLDNQILAPSQFVMKEVWEKLNGYDENIPFIEDWPFWIKAYKIGIKIAFLDEPTVKYRIHESLSCMNSPSQMYMNSLQLAKEYAGKCQYKVSPLFRFYDYVRGNVKSPIIRRIFFVWNPYYWYIKQIHSLIK